jgi:SAM-dependent methyltransferase
MLVTRVRNVFRGLLQRYGTEDIKKWLWDKEFASGRWDCLDNMAEDCLYPYVEKYVNEGSILDLGCGPGATGNELSAERYRFYTGVDISEVAVEKARKRTERNQRSAKNEYFQADICTYSPARQYDVIVLGDSIYYMPEWRAATMLHRYSGYLNPGGVFVARIKGVRPEWFGTAVREALACQRVRQILASRDSSSWRRRRSILAIIESQFSVIEKTLHHYSDVVCVIVFRPSA